ncbi:MAG: hypothetical protein WC095_01185 [Candidatus Paceibacterota bacterium]
MKNLMIKGVSLLALLAFVFAPIVSNAELDANVIGSVDLVSKTNDNVLDVKIDTDTNVGTSVDTDNDGKVMVDTSSGSTSNQVKAESDTNSALKINTLGIAITSSSQVKSDADLEIFSSNVSVEKEKVDKVEIKSDEDGESKVEVVYKHRGRLLGFIPITLKSTTSVEANSDSEIVVKTRMPWWSFLVGKVDYSKTDIESKIKNNETVKANAKANASAESKAKVVEAVIAEVQADVDAQASLNK